MSYNVLESRSTGFGTLHFRLVRPAVNASASTLPTDMPLSMPRAQVYYWTRAWQEGERQALDEIARGEGRSFRTGSDAVHWLLSTDDD